MHRWAVTATIRSGREHLLSPAAAKLLAAELAHLNPKIDATRSPATLQLSILAPTPEAAFSYTRRRITQVLLPLWTTDLEIGPLSVLADPELLSHIRSPEVVP